MRGFLLTAAVLLLCGSSASAARRERNRKGNKNAAVSEEVKLELPAFSNALGFAICRPQRYLAPKSVKEVVRIVQQAQEQNVTVKAVGARLSTTDIMCTDGYAVDVSALNKVKIFKNDNQVRVGAGATLKKLQDSLAKEGLGVVLPTSKYSGTSVGGALATGTHTSSLVHPASISDQVIGLKIVTGTGEIIELDGSGLRTVAVNLGVLGIVVEVLLTVVPKFQMEVEVMKGKEAFLTNGKALEMARANDWFQIGWFPSQKKIFMTKGTFLGVNGKGTDRVDFGFVTNQYTAGFVNTVEKIQKKKDLDAFCEMEKNNLATAVKGTEGLLPFVDEDGTYKNPAKGTVNDLMTQGCDPGTCSWDYPGPKFRGQELTVAIPVNRLADAVMKIKEIIKERPMCLPTSTGIGIRFHRASNNFMSIAEGRDTAVLEILLPLRQNSDEARLGLATIQELQQSLLVPEFEARAHWGGNAISAFTSPFRDVSQVFRGFSDFENFRKAFDPQGLFENSFYRRLIRQEDIVKTEFCAIAEKCICSEDVHCAANQQCSAFASSDFTGGICEDNKN